MNYLDVARVSITIVGDHVLLAVFLILMMMASVNLWAWGSHRRKVYGVADIKIILGGAVGLLVVLILVDESLDAYPPVGWMLAGAVIAMWLLAILAALIAALLIVHVCMGRPLAGKEKLKEDGKVGA